MRAGLGFTAARQRALRLAGLAGLKPCTHFCAAEPRRGIEGHAGWPGFYCRSATGLAARRSGRVKALHPLLRGGAAQGHRGTCGLAGVLPPLGNGPRGSRVWCSFLTVEYKRPPFGDGASWLAIKASVDIKSRWPFSLQKINRKNQVSFSVLRKSTSCNAISQLASL